MIIEMKKLFLLIGLVVLFSGSIFAKTTQWKETSTTLTQFLERDDYKIVTVTLSRQLGNHQYVYHITGPLKFIMCVTNVSGSSIPLTTTCYYEDY
jgi:hypothetical protein